MTGAGPLRVEGYGTCIVLDPLTNEHFPLNNVMFVPSCPVNIYSTTQLNQEGGTFTTTNTHARITDLSGRTLTTQKHFRGIYLLKGEYPDHSAFATLDNSLETWHRRLGHVGYNALNRMRTLKCVNGLIMEGESYPPECIACTLESSNAPLSP